MRCLRGVGAARHPQRPAVWMPPHTVACAALHHPSPHRQGPWDAALQAAGERFDLVVDTIGGPYEKASLALVARGGRLAALGATGPGVERV